MDFKHTAVLSVFLELLVWSKALVVGGRREADHQTATHQTSSQTRPAPYQLQTRPAQTSPDQTSPAQTRPPWNQTEMRQDRTTLKPASVHPSDEPLLWGHLQHAAHLQTSSCHLLGAGAVRSLRLALLSGGKDQEERGQYCQQDAQGSKGNGNH